MTDRKLSTYKVREVVAVFHDAGKMEAAAEELLSAGFSRTAISIMGAAEAVERKLGDVYETVPELEDDPGVPQKAYVGKPDRMVQDSVVIGVPLYIVAMAGSLAVVASGGSAAIALAAAAAGGALGAGIGAGLARVIEDHHASKIESEIEAGGLLLWVVVADDHGEQRAIELLTAAGGEDVHPHEIERVWGEKDTAPSHWNPDPFLGKDVS